MRTAQNMVSDVGVPAASSSGGLVRFAATAKGNEERSAHAQFKKYKLGIPIPFFDSKFKRPGRETTARSTT